MRTESAGVVIEDVPGVWSGRRRLALGLSPIPGTGLILLLLGMSLGPLGLGLLTDRVLTSLDPAISVALAALGALVGLDLKVRRPRENRLLAAATLEAGTTMATVAAGMVLVHALSSGSEAVPWLLALTLGTCAASSSTAIDPSASLRRQLALRSGNLSDVLPIVLAMIVMAWTREGSPAAAAWVMARAGLIALTIAVAAWLLMTSTATDSEQRVFAIGALLLLGGAAAHLSLSALFVGFLAGVFWNAIGPPAIEGLARDMRYLQHPLVVLLLVLAGARLSFSVGVVGLVIAYVVCRVAGKLMGGWLAATVVLRRLPRELGFHLLSPGVVGIAVALNMLQAHGTLGATAFAIVVLGSLGSELFSPFASRFGGRA